MALFLCQRMWRGDLVPEFGQVPSMKATLCLAVSAMMTDFFQLSKFSPLTMLYTKTCPGLSEG